MALQPEILQSNFYVTFIKSILQPIPVSFDLPRTATWLCCEAYFDSCHILNDGNNDDVINNNDDFGIFMLAVVVFEILLAWLVVAILLVILVLVAAVLAKLLVWLVFAMFLPTGLQMFRHCKDLVLLLVMLQVMTILLNMVVMFSILAESFCKHGRVTGAL